MYTYTQIASQHEKALHAEYAARERVVHAQLELQVEIQQMVKLKKISTVKKAVVNAQQVCVH